MTLELKFEFYVKTPDKNDISAAVQYIILQVHGNVIHLSTYAVS